MAYNGEELLELADIIQKDKIQSLMDSFYKLTAIPIGIIDLKGNILVATGWQDICTKFHRLHPETLKNCIESDSVLTLEAEPGTYRLYKCKNNMWDMSTPIMAGNRRLGNLFLGQFFFTDEEIDYEIFREQARSYGFDEEEYMKALEEVPRWTRETVDQVMEFYTRFTGILMDLGNSNLHLSRSLAEVKKLLGLLEEKEKKFSDLVTFAGEPVFVARDGRFVFANRAAAEFVGKKDSTLEGLSFAGYLHPDDRPLVLDRHHRRLMGQDPPQIYNVRVVSEDGSLRWARLNTVKITWDGSSATLNFITDITELKKAEEENMYLMKEMNHRVKNNLAMVSSLINLKNAASGPGVDLSDLRHQVDAIRIVHEKLHQVEGTEEINLRDYLQDLLNNVFSSLAGGQVEVTTQIPDVTIPAKKAVPLGLIVNELAVNAIKHALPDRGLMRFSVNMSPGDGDGACELRISNSGEPFPEAVSPNNPETLGLRLVTELTRQIDGTLSLEREPETVFTIRFPV